MDAISSSYSSIQPSSCRQLQNGRHGSSRPCDHHNRKNISNSSNRPSTSSRRAMYFCVVGLMEIALLLSYVAVDASAWQSSFPRSRNGVPPTTIASCTGTISTNNRNNMGTSISTTTSLPRGGRSSSSSASPTSLAVSSTSTPTTTAVGLLTKSLLNALLPSSSRSRAETMPAAAITHQSSTSTTFMTSSNATTTTTMSLATAPLSTLTGGARAVSIGTSSVSPMGVAKKKSVLAVMTAAAAASVILLGGATTAQYQTLITACITTLFTSYQNALIEHPLTSKVLTGATLAIIGDAVAQYTTAKSSTKTSNVSYDKRRAVSFAAFDACYRVFQNTMFPAVIGLCKGTIVKSLVPVAAPRVAAAIERTLLYQLVIVPSLYYPVFFVFTGFIQGLSFKETVDRMKTNYFKCWGRNLQFWIPTQFVLFGMINEHWQIPFACVMGMIWSSILSLTAGSAKKS